jgi:UPF0176 protein
MQWTVAALYKFLDLPHFAELQADLQTYCESRKICGILLLAPEGINGTVAGPNDSIQSLLIHLQDELELGPIEAKFSATQDLKPFRKMKVRLKREIVHLGRPDLNPLTNEVGTYVAPQDWNALISDPEVRVIDTRNDFECNVGTFAGAENPKTESFADFPEYVAEHLDPAKDRKVAMFCTGGIRCEKATAYLKEQGFEEVYHLKGGILQYLEDIPEDQSLWQGECFVFDDRITVDHQLRPGKSDCCRGCWNPLLPDDRDHPDYEEGVSCPRCRPQKNPQQIASARERERQRKLAEAREQKRSAVRPSA